MTICTFNQTMLRNFYHEQVQQQHQQKQQARDPRSSVCAGLGGGVSICEWEAPGRLFLILIISLEEAGCLFITVFIWNEAIHESIRKVKNYEENYIAYFLWQWIHVKLYFALLQTFSCSDRENKQIVVQWRSANKTTLNNGLVLIVKPCYTKEKY